MNIFNLLGIGPKDDYAYESASDDYQAMPTVVDPEDVETVIGQVADEVDGINTDRLEDEDTALDNMPSEIEKEIEEIDEATSIDIEVGSSNAQIEGNEFAEKLGGIDLSDDAPTIPVIKELEEAGEINSSQVLDDSFAENHEVEEMLEEEFENDKGTPLSNDEDDIHFLDEKNVDFVEQTAGDGYADDFSAELEEDDSAPLADDKDEDNVDGIEEKEVEAKEVEGDDETALDEAEEVNEVDEEPKEVATEEVEESDAEEVLSDIDFDINSTQEDAEDEVEDALDDIEIDGSSAFDEVEEVASVNTEEGNQEFEGEVAEELEADEEVETDESVVDVILDTVEEDEKEYEENDPVENKAEEMLEEAEPEEKKESEVVTESVADIMRKKILSWL